MNDKSDQCEQFWSFSVTTVVTEASANSVIMVFCAIRKPTSCKAWHTANKVLSLLFMKKMGCVWTQYVAQHSLLAAVSKLIFFLYCLYLIAFSEFN